MVFVELLFSLNFVCEKCNVGADMEKSADTQSTPDLSLFNVKIKIWSTRFNFVQYKFQNMEYFSFQCKFYSSLIKEKIH